MLNKFLIKNTSDKKSLTASAFFYGFIIVNLKLICSGLTFNGFTISAFTGSEYAMAVSALGAVYVLRRNTEVKNDIK